MPKNSPTMQEILGVLQPLNQYARCLNPSLPPNTRLSISGEEEIPDSRVPHLTVRHLQDARGLYERLTPSDLTPGDWVRITEACIDSPANGPRAVLLDRGAWGKYVGLSKRPGSGEIEVVTDVHWNPCPPPDTGEVFIRTFTVPLSSIEKIEGDR